MNRQEIIDVAINGTRDQRHALHNKIMSLPFSDRQIISMTLHARRQRED